MRVLVLGGGGMLGHKVAQVLSTRFETFATVLHPTHYPLGKVITDVNALDFSSVVRAFIQARPDTIVNCIGIVKQRNTNALTSIGVNSVFPHQLADLCEATEVQMIHISTDCVFSGRKGNYTERDIPDPEDLYGQTKLLGESDRCLTIRTSIIGRDLKQIGLLEWFMSQKQVRGYTNAIFTGFPTQVLARIIGDIITNYRHLSGLYHVASAPISKYDLLVKIRDAMDLDIEITPYDALPCCDRSLNPARFLAATNYKIPSWDEMIAELAADTTPYDEWRAKYA